MLYLYFIKQTQITQAMKNFTEAQVVSHLVKSGWNEEEAIKVVAANYEYVRNTYPEARCAKVAEIVTILD